MNSTVARKGRSKENKTDGKIKKMLEDVLQRSDVWWRYWDGEEETNFYISSSNSGTRNSVLLIAEHNLKTLPGYRELLEDWSVPKKQTNINHFCHYLHELNCRRYIYICISNKWSYRFEKSTTIGFMFTQLFKSISFQIVKLLTELRMLLCKNI